MNRLKLECRRHWQTSRKETATPNAGTRNRNPGHPSKGVEQALINLAWKEGIQLENKINSIARSNHDYERALAFGEKVLSDLGFKF